MSKFSLEAILSLTDNLTKPYQKNINKITGMNKSLGGTFGALNRGIDAGFMGVAKTSDKLASSLTTGLKRAGTIAGVGLTVGIGLATVALKKLSSEASKIEDATASFTPLMGSVEKATELVKRLNKEAATTPFQFEGISSIAKQLLPVMNGSIEDTANTFRMLGDTAGGNIQKLESITRGYTKALLKGKPDMEALNMISEAGVPIFTEMAKTMSITVDQLFEMSKQGKLTNTDLTNTFKNMTKEGGIFFKGMEISSKTLTGKFSTLKDNISLTVASIGTALLPTIKKMVDKGIEFAQIIREWVNANQELINQNITSFIEKLKTGIYKAKTAFENIKTIIDSVKIALSNFWDLMKQNTAIQNVINKAEELGVKFKETFIDNGSELLKSFTQYIESFDFTPLVDGIGFIVQSIMNATKFILDHKGVIEGLVITLASFKLAVMAVNAVLLIQKGLMVAGGALEMIKVFMSLAKTEGILASAQLALNVAMTANPIGLIVVAVAAAIASLVALGVLIYKNRDAIKDFFLSIKELVVNGFEKIAPALELVGRGFMTYLLAPINLVIEAIKWLLTIISEIPGVGDKLKPALDALQGFQDNMNTVTLIGANNNVVATEQQTQPTTDNPNNAPSLESYMAMQKDKQEKDRETKQRFDINLNAPMGYGMSVNNATPTTAISLGGQ